MYLCPVGVGCSVCADQLVLWLTLSISPTVS